MSERVRITALAQAEFATLRQEWEDLLARSQADPLFMSWDWQWLWWKHHGGLLNAQLRLFAVRSSAGRLLALLPLYERTVRLRGLPLRRLELLGHAWQDGRAFYSEYLDLIIDRDAVALVLPAVFDHLRGLLWDEFVVAGALPDSHIEQALRPWVVEFAALRESEPLKAYRIPLGDGFEAFVRALPQSVRRRLLNHRQRIADPELRFAADAQIAPALEVLSRFKRVRWGERYADSPAIRGFGLELAQRLHALQRLSLSCLSSGGTVWAVMFNARIGSREYYLQSAFDPEQSRSLSLGYLHFGYAIEAAAKQSVTQFDLLAGAGLSTDYKRELGSTPVRLTSFQAIRPLWLRILYSAYDLWLARTAR